MTPADRAMKAALEESARYADSPPSMAPAAHPLVGRPPHPNVTSFGSQIGKSSDPLDGSSSSRPTTPHITLHEFHKLQQSPVPSSPDIDYKRVRRKQSFASLIRLPPGASLLPAPNTSSSNLLHSRPSKSLLPSLLPPLPLTPAHRSSPNSPSLSSTVDTLQSTPTHTPIQRVFWPLEQWGGVELGGLSEPIRTKRKFLPFKQAKRLPHHSAHHGGSEDTWEVHAAVIDVGSDIEGWEEREDVPAHVGDARSERAEYRGLTVEDEEESSRRRGRLVRFEGLEVEESSGASEGPASPQSPFRGEREPNFASTSSISLSKFNFPAPPGSNWEGTFGHLTEPTSPTSPATPATLHYKGVSFDVVNPHSSLLLGVSDIETPAEIDGLLDNYFDSDDANMQPYSDKTGEKSSSQHSLQTTASNGRQRILYDDADSARRNIMGIPSSTSQQTVIASPYPGQRSGTPPMPSPAFIPRPATPNLFTSPNIERHRGLQIHSRLRDLLDLRTAGSSRVMGHQFEDDELEDELAEGHYPAVSTHESHWSPALADAEDPARADRSSSIYPHSRRSYPFDLTLSEDEDDPSYRNVDDVVAAGRRSHYTASGDRAADFTIYEDAGDANARTQSALEQETTVGNILSHYNYPRPPFGIPAYDESPYQDYTSQSASIELVRGGGFATNPFLTPQAGRGYDVEPAPFPIAPLDSPDPTLERLWGAPRAQGPPNIPMPTPPMPRRPAPGAIPYYSDVLDPVATDQTYGSTGQLLRLTPQAWRDASRGINVRGPSTLHRRRQHIDQGFEEVATTTADTRPTPAPSPVDDGDEDKENTPPQSARPNSSLSVTPAPEATYYAGPRRIRGPATMVNLPATAMQRTTSSFYPDDESIWESTQSSESNENLAELTEPPRMEFETLQDDARPSQDSYANTSVAGSNVRLSLPRPGTAMPMPPASVRRRWPAIVATASSGLAAREGGLMPAASMNADEERAKRILEDKMMEDAILGQRNLGTPTRDQTQYTSDMKELEAIRQKNPTAVERAVKAVSEGIGKLTQMQPAYTPQASASKMTPFGLGKNTPDSRYSETKGLLDEQTASPYSNRGLRFSETANTFQTTTRMPSFLTGQPIQGYSPLTPPPITPPATAHVRDFHSASTIHGAAYRPSPELPGTESIEMKRLPRRRRVSRVAMSSQTELRPLQLADSTAASGMSGGRLTDMQLAEAEGGWTMRPDFSENRPLSRLPVRASVALNSRQSDDSLAENNQLMRPHDARNLHVRRTQRHLTRPYFRCCIIFPLTALIFGCGGMDWRMKQMTGGRITEMLPSAKKHALMLYFPLGIIVYAVLGLVIGLIVVVVLH